MAEYKKEQVNDIFRKINNLNEISDNSKENDKDLKKHIITKIIPTKAPAYAIAKTIARIKLPTFFFKYFFIRTTSII